MMGKGFQKSGKKHKRHYAFKRRCYVEKCKKRAVSMIGGHPYCAKHQRTIMRGTNYGG